MSRLVLFCEGGAHTVEYFHKNGVYPGAVVLETSKYREMIPYLADDDEVLVIVKGLTDFSPQEIYSLLRDIDETSAKLKSVVVMSNIHLGAISAPYYLYSGDLFYGSLQKVENNRISDLTKEDYEFLQSVGGNRGIEDAPETEEGKKRTRKKSRAIQNTGGHKSINAVMERYKIYSSRKAGLTVYGSKSKEGTLAEDEDTILPNIVEVDLFAKSTMEDGEV